MNSRKENRKDFNSYSFSVKTVQEDAGVDVPHVFTDCNLKLRTINFLDGRLPRHLGSGFDARVEDSRNKLPDLAGVGSLLLFQTPFRDTHAAIGNNKSV